MTGRDVDWRMVERRLGNQARCKAPPTISQVETIGKLNEAIGSSYPVPASEADARFLIDGMVDEERRLRRSRR